MSLLSYIIEAKDKFSSTFAKAQRDVENLGLTWKGAFDQANDDEIAEFAMAVIFSAVNAGGRPPPTTRTMNTNFRTERDLVARAYREAVLSRDPKAPEMLVHLARCETHLRLVKMIDQLDRASDFRCREILASDEAEIARLNRESVLAEREALLIWSAPIAAGAVLSEAEVPHASAEVPHASLEQLGEHALRSYSVRLAEEGSAGA